VNKPEGGTPVKRILPLILVLTLATALAPALQAAEQPERWLHVRVDNQEAKGEMVRVNVPLTLAEKVLAAVNNDKLRNGRVLIDRAQMNGVDLRALFDAVRTARDGEYVTVQGTSGEVRVSKQGGYLLVRVREDKDSAPHRVEVQVPLTVVEALLSAGNNELDLVAAIRALAAHGDTELVTVKDEKSTVRIWLDTKSETQ
jgi:hypothetical protein